MAIRAGREKLNPRIKGVAMVHPEVWELASPNSVDGVDDPWLNVVGSGLGCERVLVAVAGKDVFGRQGLTYVAKLEKSGWRGELEVVEEEEEGPCFHLPILTLKML
ncbi:putative carboxylesterase 3 [Raphanus sativus]|nr:putative carboxylesterase 3 [Raphanus sativus]